MAASEAPNPSRTNSRVATEQHVLAANTTLLNDEAAAIWEQALAKASHYLTNLLSDPATFAANLQVLLANLGGELAGTLAAYAAIDHTGT